MELYSFGSFKKAMDRKCGPTKRGKKEEKKGKGIIHQLNFIWFD